MSKGLINGRRMGKPWVGNECRVCVQKRRCQTRDASQQDPMNVRSEVRYWTEENCSDWINVDKEGRLEGLDLRFSGGEARGQSKCIVILESGLASFKLIIVHCTPRLHHEKSQYFVSSPHGTLVPNQANQHLPLRCIILPLFG